MHASFIIAVRTYLELQGRRAWYGTRLLGENSEAAVRWLLKETRQWMQVYVRENLFQNLPPTFVIEPRTLRYEAENAHWHKPWLQFFPRAALQSRPDDV